MTVADACQLLGINRRALHQRLQDAGLPSTRGSHTRAGVLSHEAEQIVRSLKKPRRSQPRQKPVKAPLSAPVVVQTPAPMLHDAHEIDRLRQDVARLERYAEDTHVLMGELIRTVEALQKAQQARRPFWSGWRAWWQRPVVVEDARRPEFAPTEIYYAERLRA